MANGSRKAHGGDPVLSKIDRIRRTATYWIMGWGYMWTVLIVAGLIFAGVLLDHAFILQKWERLAFFRVFVLALSAAALAATLFPLVKRVNRLYIARRMEALRPELKNALISYLQCRDNPETPLEIKHLMQQKVVHSIQALGTDVVVDPGRYLRLSLVFAALLLAFIAYGAVSPKSAVVSVERLLWPRAEILPPTATRLTAIEPGELYTIVGDEPPLKVKVEGIRPSGVYAVWNGTTFDDRRILLSKKGEDQWEGAFPPILENGNYYVVARDTRSDRFGITALPTPTVTQLELTLTPPAYTGLPARTVTDGNLDVVAGTLIGLRATTSLPPQSGVLEFDSGRRVWLQPADGQNVLEGQFKAVRSDAYVARFETIRYPSGVTFKNPSPVKYRIICRDDQPPSVKLLAPPDGIRVQPADKVTIVYSARDDFSVERVNLRYSFDGVLTPALKIGEPRLAKVEDTDWEWNLATIGAPPGAVVTYYLEVEDNRPELPQVGRSETRRILIAGPEAPAGTPAASPGAEEKAGPARPEPATQQEPAEAPQTAPPAEERAEARPPTVTPPGQPPKEVQGEQNGAPSATEDEARRQRDEYARKVAELLGREAPASANGEAPQSSAQPGPGSQEGGRQAPATDQQVNPPPEPAAQSGAGEGAGKGTGTGERTPQEAAQPQPAVPPEGVRAERSASGAGQAGERQGAAPDGNAAPAAAAAQGEGRAAGGEQSATAQGEREGGEAAEAGAEHAQGAAQGQGGEQAPAAEGAEGAAGTPQGEQGAPSARGSGGARSASSGQASAQPGAGEPGESQAGGAQPGTGGGAAQSGAQAGGEPGRAGEQGQAGARSGGAPRAGEASGGEPGGQSSAGANAGEGTTGSQQGSSEGAAAASSRTGSAGVGGGRSVALGPARSGGSGGGAPGTGVAALPQPGAREEKLPQRDVDNAVEELGRMLDEDRLPPGLLKDLGTDRQRLRQFVDRYRRDRQEGQNAEGTPGQEQPEAAEKPGHVMETGKEAGKGVAAKDALPTKLQKDTLRSRFEGADQRLSARYREAVNRYYKVLSEEQ